MPLAAGTRLGPYEVLGLIGAGGMGEVYRGRDTRLDRTVAIKVLPAEVAADPDRRARFAREAKAISQLAHPHICVLYDVGQAAILTPESPASSPVTVDYLVMEYLAGETLAEHLARVAARTPHSGPPTPPGSGRSGTPAAGRAGRGAPLPLDEALRIGTELAEALAAAHKAGIIHRDLKPGNVMLTPAGVKVLDFGLARLHVAEAAPGAASLATRPAEPLTDAGTRLGTVPYMAPEQVEGKEADARSDVFALGAILYEMATGHRAFEGETAASVAAAILDREPEPVTAVQPLTPPAFEHVVTTCLAKDPEARWQAASDVGRELRWIADERRLTRTPTGGLPPGAATVAALAAGRRRRWFIVAALTTSIAVIAAGVAWLLRAPAPQVSPAHVSLDVRPAEELNAGGARRYVRTPGGSRTALTWTPDGQALVFVGRRGGTQQLYVRQLDADEATPIDGTEDAQLPAVSPDGDWVAFWARGTIKKVRIGGGPVMDVKSGVASPPFGLIYDGRGYLYFGQIDGGIGEISVDGRFVLVTTLREGEIGHNSPWPLPDGRTLLYTVRKRSRSWGGEEIVAQNLATRDRSVLLKDAADARYVSTGHLVFLRLGTLFAVPFDAGRVEIGGAPVPVLGGVAQSLTAKGVWDVTGAGQLAIALTTGTLAWIPGPLVPNDEAALVTVDRRGQASPLSVPPRSYNGALRLSPDGRRLAVTIKSLTEVGLWVVDIAGGTLTPLTLDGEVYWPLWSPDGSRLVFQWLKDGRWSLAAQPLDRTAAPEILLANREVDPSSFTRDGRLAGHEAGDIVLVTVGDGKTSVDTLVQTSKEDLAPAVSRDGGWLAYTSSVSGQREIYVRPYPGPGETKQVWSRMGGMDPAWHPNGREMFFVADVEKEWTLLMMAVDVAPGSPLRIGTPRQLFEFDPRVLWFVGGLVRNYDVALDGQRFYVMQARNPPPPPVVTHINLIQNWFEELKAKVPVR